jgi:hypothetical protein
MRWCIEALKGSTWRWGGSSTQAWMPTYVSILRIPQMIWVWRATVEWYWRENRRTRRKTCPSATLSATNPIWIDPGANPSLRGERPTTNNLSHGTAFWRVNENRMRWLEHVARMRRCAFFSVRKTQGKNIQRYKGTAYVKIRGSISGRGERIFPLSSVSRPALRPTQPPVQWAPGVVSLGVKRGWDVTLITHPHLMQRSRISRSYASSTPSASMACSGTAFTVAYNLYICVYDSDGRKSYSHSVPEDGRTVETCWAHLIKLIKIINW